MLSRLKSIVFPVSVCALGAAVSFGTGRYDISGYSLYGPGTEMLDEMDTVVYNPYDFKSRMVGEYEETSFGDSLYNDSLFLFNGTEPEDTLEAADTITAPDSLRETDPFRYKYYVALVDVKTHYKVMDTLRLSFTALMEKGDTLLARQDSVDRFLLDSIYVSDSLAAAEAAFIAWYNSLSKEERKDYDYEQKMIAKKHRLDSITLVKEDKKAIKDSIVKFTPRILDTYMLPHGMQYKRLIRWHLDTDFGSVTDLEEPDTSLNAHFYDYEFRRRDVGGTWLGMSGSAVQPYNWKLRDERPTFYSAYESWSFTPSTLPMYNTKMPYTELGYTGTILSTRSKESDNIHIFTTQNILPELNLTLLYDRWGGEGILINERTANKTGLIALNWLGKKYSMHTAFISNNIQRNENWGIVDNYWIRDTTVDPREVPVVSSKASSKTKSATVFLNQQFRIGENLLIGHHSEFVRRSRIYNDGTAAKPTFKGADSTGVTTFENKLYAKFSILEAGVGAITRKTADTTITADRLSFTENNTYVYAGTSGELFGFDWKASFRKTLTGREAGDSRLEADINYGFYPFRKARTSPVNIFASLEMSSLTPLLSQEYFATSRLSWAEDFERTTRQSLSAGIDIPYWDLSIKADYGLLGNYIYYGTDAKPHQHDELLQVFSATIKKDITLGGLHLCNSVLLQKSSDGSVLPLPLAAANLRWYFQFVPQKSEDGLRDIMTMQIGANVYCNTKWYSPSYSPETGMFHNQDEFLYNNGPIIDAFINIQWQKVCLFLKVENVGKGWPMESADYFSANHYVYTPATFKVGIWWPFYKGPEINLPTSSLAR